MSEIKRHQFVCIDCETTGLDVKKDRVIEIAAMRFDFDQVYEEFESLINPEIEIPASSIVFHNITPQMVEGKPVIAQVLPQVLELIGDHIIVGHGVQFDIDMLATAAERHRIKCNIRNNRFLDTLRMARLYGESPINSLEQLRKHFNIPFEGSHRAMSDVIVNKEVFKYLARSYKTLEHLFDALSRPILLKVMPLGEYKGRLISEVPLQNLKWLAKKNFDQDLTFSIQTELRKRKKGNLFNQASNPFSHL